MAFTKIVLLTSLILLQSCDLDGQDTFLKYYPLSANFEFVFPDEPEIEAKYSVDSVLVTESMILFDHSGKLKLGHIVWYNMDILDTKPGGSELKDLILRDFSLFENCEMNHFDNRKDGFSFTMENDSAFYILKHRKIEGYELTSLYSSDFQHINFVDSVKIYPVPIMFEIRLENFQTAQEWYIEVKFEDEEMRYLISDSNKFEITVSEFRTYTITIGSTGFEPKSVMINPTGNLSAGLTQGYIVPFSVNLFRKGEGIEESEKDFVGVLNYEENTGYMSWKRGR